MKTHLKKPDTKKLRQIRHDQQFALHIGHIFARAINEEMRARGHTEEEAAAITASVVTRARYLLNDAATRINND